jgi:hypothetical protein
MGTAMELLFRPRMTRDFPPGRQRPGWLIHFTSHSVHLLLTSRHGHPEGFILLSSRFSASWLKLFKESLYTWPGRWGWKQILVIAFPLLSERVKTCSDVTHSAKEGMTVICNRLSDCYPYFEKERLVEKSSEKDARWQWPYLEKTTAD